jgi:glycosyltransferase involved in cell wall biosynthesis
MRILFLATYFPRPLNPTIGTWALEQAKALKRASTKAPLRVASSELRLTSGGQSAGDAPATINPPPVTSFRVVSGNPWFPKISGRLKAGIRVYSDCPRNHSWDGVEVDYLPMLFYPFGKLDAIFNRVGEPMLRLGWWSIKRRLMKIVKELRPDVIYAHHTVPNGFFAFRIHTETGIPIFITDHLIGEITACSKYPKRRHVFERVFEASSCLVCGSKVIEKEIKKIFPHANCVMLHNGVNLLQAPSESRVERRESSAAHTPATCNTKLDTAPQALVPSTLDSHLTTPLIILSCGMLSEQKNFIGLIEAFNLLAEKYPNVVLRILGDGAYRFKVEQARSTSPFKDRIELTGKLPHAQVLNQMLRADIFILISWRELMGAVFLEAMASGLPVIACNDGGIAEIIAGVELPDNLKLGNPEKLKPSNANGLLVPPEDIPAAARALEFLLLNPEARKQIGEAARKKIEAELTWDAVAQKYLQIFNQKICS